MDHLKLVVAFAIKKEGKETHLIRHEAVEVIVMSPLQVNNTQSIKKSVTFSSAYRIYFRL